MDMKTLVLGVGNPILSDDGVGVCVVEELKKIISDPDIDFRCESTFGLDLVEIVRGYDRLIIVDAILTAEKRVGEVMKLALSDLPKTVHFSSLHDVDMATALDLGEEMGERMPAEVVVFAVEVEDVASFGEELSPSVENAVPTVVDRIRKELTP